jgi:uncharacterized protein with beta-barrel porin domain
MQRPWPADLRRPVVAAAGCLALLAIAGAPGMARADCSQAGSAVTCSGDDSDGFAAAADDLDLEVAAGATVSNAAGDVIQLLDRGTVTVRDGGSVSATAANARAILVGAGDMNAEISIEPGGSVSSSGAGGIAIEAGSGWSIESSGTITGDVVLGDGDEFFGNSGTMTGDIIAGNGNDIVTNSGTLDGDVMFGGGDDILGLDGISSWTGMFDGGSEATADLVFLGSLTRGSLDLDTLSNFEELEINSGRWTLRETGSFSGGTVVRDLGTLVVDGSSATHPSGATTLNGDVLFEPDSRLRINIDPVGEQGHLIVNGDVTTTGPVDLVIVTPSPLLSDTYELVSANSIGSFVLPTLVDSAFIDFDFIQTATDLDLVVTRLSSYAAAGISTNQRKLGGNLDEILAAGPTGDLAELMAELDTLSFGGARSAFDTLHAEAYDAHSSATLSLGSSLADLVARDRPRCDADYRFRLFGREQRQPNPCGAGGRRVWADVLVRFAERDNVSDFIDYDTSQGAFVLGVDWDLGEWLVSGFLGSSSSQIDIKQIGDGDAYSIELGGLARRHFGPLRVETLALYGHAWHDQRREIFVSGPRGAARGEFGSNRFLSRSELAYVADIAGAQVSPIAQLEYAYLSEQGFVEQGAGGAALRVDDRATSYLRSGIGARVVYEGLKYYWLSRWLSWTDGTWRGEIHGRWLKTWKGDQRDINARFAQAPPGTRSFRSAAQDVEQATVFGTRITFQPLLYEATLSAGYDFQFGDATTAHQATVTANIPF